MKLFDLSSSLFFSSAASPTRREGQKSSYIPTPQLSRPPRARDDHSYENTKLEEIPMDDVPPPRKGTGEVSGNYTAVPDSLPAFLRNEDMLGLPEVSDDVVKTAQKDFDESYARLSMIKIDSNLGVEPGDDYMDPQDARDKACTTKTHEKLNKRVSKTKLTSEPPVTNGTSSTTGKKAIMANREDYSMVSDALPDGSFSGKVAPSGVVAFRPRTTSDTSPMKKMTPNLKKKSDSMKQPVHIRNPASQPLHRRSTAKEMVTFDPKAGFKLSAKRTASDGSPRTISHKEEEVQVKSAPHSPVDEKKTIQPDVGGKHVYAAVDLTAKCRPESDIIRREGVGTPDHYVACM